MTAMPNKALQQTEAGGGSFLCIPSLALPASVAELGSLGVSSRTAMNESLAEAQAAIDREDHITARSLLLPLAQSGHAEAQFLMGYLFFTSADVSRSDSHAWLERAAAQNHPQALYRLAGMSHEWDSGPPQDEPRRLLLVRAAELGCIEAQRDVGCCYATGEGGFPIDGALARLWYHRAAEQGHADAQYNYGGMLIDGEGGPKDHETGVEWVRRAAAQSDVSALHYLAQLEPSTENA